MLRASHTFVVHTVIAVDKPLGWTPLEAISALRLQRAEFAYMRLGFAGRLDPMAEGLLLVLCGDETRNVQSHRALDKEYEVDVLIYATGFEVQQTGIYNRIVGAGGRALDDKYADGIRTLLGIHTAGFPNLFVMGGYQASFQFNLTDLLQVQGDHIANCIAYAREHGYTTVDCSDESEEWWVPEVIEHRGKTNRNAECTPGYYNFEGESNRRQDGNYNGGFPAYAAHMASTRERIEELFVLA